MMVLEIDDRRLEAQISDFLKTQKKDLKEFTTEAIMKFLDKFSQDELTYKRQNPKAHIRKIKYVIDEEDEVPYKHVKDSVEYVKELRRNKR